MGKKRIAGRDDCAARNRTVRTNVGRMIPGISTGSRINCSHETDYLGVDRTPSVSERLEYGFELLFASEQDD